MGLQERKAVESFQAKEYKDYQNSINEITGFSVNIEVDWESIAEEGRADCYNDDFSKLYFLPVIDAFKFICRDEFGQRALQENLKKIVICNKSDNYGQAAISFSENELKIDHKVTNVDYVKDRTEVIQDVLEKALTGDQQPPKISDLVAKMPARSTREVLSDLMWLKANIEDKKELPEVTFTFQHGGCASGRLVDIQVDKNPGSVLLSVENNYQKHDLIYFPTASIQMIRLHNIDKHVYRFSGGKIDPLQMKPAPGKLTLERYFYEISKSLEETVGKKIVLTVDWKTFAVDDFMQMASIKELVENLQESLQNAEQDFVSEFGKKISTVQVINSTEKNISCDGITLKIKYPADG